LKDKYQGGVIWLSATTNIPPTFILPFFQCMTDPSMEQTAAGLSNTQGIGGNINLTNKEIEILRSLAGRVAEIASRPSEFEKRKLWTLHNDLKETRPLIFCDPENGWNEIVRQREILCTNPLARVWEMSLRKEIFWGVSMLDDRVIEPFFNVPYHYHDNGYGLAEKVIGGLNGGSFVYDFPLKEYETHFDKLSYPVITVDYEKTHRILNLAHEVFDGLLQVRLKGVWWWTLGMTWDFMKLRGLENLMLDMIISPEWVMKLMDFLCSSVHRKLDFLEANGLLSLNTGGSYVGSGGFGWTEQLPGPGFDEGKVKTTHMWGFAESQETIGVSPEMFGQFIFPFQKTILERFGLNCYGCCEPLDPRWDYISQIPNLRRVSVSPWADIRKMSEYLGKNYILSIKPSPVPLASAALDEGAVRKELAEKLAVARDCCVEVIMKDNHTLGGNPQNAVRWCEIAREEINKL
jgi:hypothetical protein